MATDKIPPPSACDALRIVRQAQHELEVWADHLQAVVDGAEGHALPASRVADIVTSTLAGAACDTRALAREAIQTATNRAA